MTYRVDVRDDYNPADGGVMIADAMSRYTASFLAEGFSKKNHCGMFDVVNNQNDETVESWKHGVDSMIVIEPPKASKLYR